MSCVGPPILWLTRSVIVAYFKQACFKILLRAPLGNILSRMGNDHNARFDRMLEVTMVTGDSSKVPAVFLKCFDDFTGIDRDFLLE